LGFSIHTMDKFNKFIKNTEELTLLITPKARAPRIYFVLSLLVLTFFMLWPIWQAGHQGFWLWCAWTLFLLFTLLKFLLTKGNFYLLTDQRIIFLKASDENKFLQLVSFDLDRIEKIAKHNNDSIYLMIDNKKIYLFGIKDRNKVFKVIKNNLQ
jgi:hypothetical protein